jgi:flagellar biosynthesis protein FliR
VDLQLQATTLAALLLGTARAAGFVAISPPFAGRGLPATVKAAMAMSLSLVMLPHVMDDIPEVTAPFLITAAVSEFLIGAGLGFVVAVLFAAVQMAGDILDVTGGFSLQPAYDPLSMNMSANIGRLHYLLAVTLLFTTGGHLMLMAGFVRSYEALPVGNSIPTEQLASILITAFGMMLLAAAQIAGPLVGVLVLADLGLALLSRAAPALQVLTLGFPLKIMVTLTLLGLTFPLLPPAIDAIVENAVRAMTSWGR